jgi:uncharacterized protein (DUF1330 family)
MSSYVVAQITINDREKYTQYEAGFMDVFSQFGGQILAVDEAPVSVEGQWSHTRTVLLQFENLDDAKAWYYSEEYQALAKHRWEASVADIAFVQGVPVSQ